MFMNACWWLVFRKTWAVAILSCMIISVTVDVQCDNVNVSSEIVWNYGSICTFDQTREVGSISDIMKLIM